MNYQLRIYRDRTNVIPANLGDDYSSDVISSEIRVTKSTGSPLIATFDVSPVTDGSDGEYTFTLDNSISSGITRHHGYMDIKRVVGGEPQSILAEPLLVIFEGVVTA